MRKNSIPMRRCAGCMESRPKSQLLRFVWADGELAFDQKKTMPGRGAYLCEEEEKRINCLEKAIKKNSFSRTLRRDIPKSSCEKLRKIFDDIG